MSKSERKKLHKEIQAKYILDKEMADNPDWCYCDKLGIGADIDESNPIGKTDSIDGFPYHNSTGYQENIYLCKKCGKKYILQHVY